jgi:hypothetical protein
MKSVKGKVFKCHWHACQESVVEGERYCSGPKSPNHKELDRRNRELIAKQEKRTVKP